MSESISVSALQARRSSLVDDRTAAQAKITALQTVIDGLNAEITAINISINELDSTINALNAVPSLDELNPTYLTVELTTPPTLAVVGSGFISGETEILLDGVAQATTVDDSNNASCAVPLSYLDETGSIAVTVRNPAPGGGTSSALTIQVVYADPVATTVDPDSIVSPAGGDTTISVDGTGFYDVTEVLVNGSAVSTTFISDTEVQADIVAALAQVPGTITVAVRNPTPGGGTSDVLVVTVS